MKPSRTEGLPPRAGTSPDRPVRIDGSRWIIAAVQDSVPRAQREVRSMSEIATVDEYLATLPAE